MGKVSLAIQLNDHLLLANGGYRLLSPTPRIAKSLANNQLKINNA
jgi:hypothetical protein